MEELRQLGTLDPAAQNKLMEDLKQTDPALWPLVMQQFRAAIAYKRRAAQRESMATMACRKRQFFARRKSNCRPRRPVFGLRSAAAQIRSCRAKSAA